jgi:ADP-ribose pyrophosphatase
MTYWKQLSRKVIYTSSWLTVMLDKLELPNGRVIDNFELMHYPHTAVGIVAVNEKCEILLVRAYRYFQETFQWEIPGGVVEPEEPILEACRRELEEETGYTCSILTPFSTFYPHKATCDQKFHLYLGENLCKTDEEFQKEEVSEVGFHSLDNVKKMIDSGEIDDGMSLVALQRYLLRHTNHKNGS